MRERIFKRIDEFCDMGIFALSFSGGEPLLNPSTSDYIAYAADKGMWTSMPTNGLLIKKYADGRFAPRHAGSFHRLPERPSGLPSGAAWMACRKLSRTLISC